MNLYKPSGVNLGYETFFKARFGVELVSRGNEFHTFTTLTEETRPCTSVTMPFKQCKTVTTCALNKTKFKDVINWHVNNTIQNFVAPGEINPKTS